MSGRTREDLLDRAGLDEKPQNYQLAYIMALEFAKNSTEKPTPAFIFQDTLKILNLADAKPETFGPRD
ncbi:hypothetical protein [Desulfocurvus sp. DL9XJH121]